MNTNREAPGKEVWIALVGVKPREGTDLLGENAKGAYVNILAWVSDAKGYRAEIEHALDDYGLSLITIEDMEPLFKRTAKFIIDEELQRLAEEVKKTKNVRFGAFHTYLNEEV